MEKKNLLRGIHMACAYILIKTLPGHEREVYYKCFYIPEICEAHPLVGEYSLIVKIKTDAYDTLGYVAADKIGKVDNITAAEILPVLEDSSIHQRLETPLQNVL
jgi:DNA-binding Lrp family transcriptional regulator